MLVVEFWYVDVSSVNHLNPGNAKQFPRLGLSNPSTLNFPVSGK